MKQIFRSQKFNIIISIHLLIGLMSHNSTFAQRTKYNFNNDWKLKVGNVENASSKEYNTLAWQEVTLPYAWNQNEAFKNDIVDLSIGIAWYRKSFILPENADQSRIFIEFEGVRQSGEVFINGTFIGRSENGVMAFGFNLTPFVKPYPEENVIAVKTDNSWDYNEKLSGSIFQWNDKNFNANYGGIPKNVYLHVVPEVYQTLPLFTSLGTTGTYVYASDIDVQARKAIVNIESQVKNETRESAVVQLRVIVEDMNKETIAEFTGNKYLISPLGMLEITAADTVKNLNFWSWGYGYLYTVYSELIVNDQIIDKVKIRTGFRKTKFANGMISLNDRVIMMKGYAQRTSNEWPSIGMSVPAWLSDYSNSLVIEGNGNMFRWMHVTPWKQDIESCDRVGLIHAMPAGDSEGDVTGRRWEQRKELMRDAIIYNRNNPSILFYECGNENISEKHMAEMLKIKQKYDPNGGRAIGSREMLNSKVAEYGGEMLYINKSAEIPFWAMEYSRDEGLRKYWDEFTLPFHKDGDGPLYHDKPANEYNRNQDSHAIEDVVRWFDYWEMRPGTGERVSSGGANIIFSDSNTHHRGKENYRRSGEVDPMRIPKENYWAHQVIWDGWVDTDTIRAYIIGHWNYETGVVKDITVVSTADKLELFVNNKSLGMGKQSKHFLFTFKDIAFKAGTIKAIGYDKTGKVVCENYKETAGKPYAVKLKSIQRPGGMLADAQDLALVQVEVVDKKGNRCPTALNMIDFNVKGEGEFIGGIAQGPDNCIGHSSLPVECGINRIFIRSTKNSGVINLTANSAGLKTAIIEIETRETNTEPLSTVMPNNDLPSYLKMGPTPQTPSFTVTRKALKIQSVHTAANQVDAWKSYDDDEMSEWRNDGNLSTGYIIYELERKSQVDQVVMKLQGWRNRSYPIDVLVDNKVVWSGNTTLSLGYITLNIEPTTGKEIAIRLTGANIDDDAFANMIELSGKKEGEIKDEDKNQIGNLRIIEIEFYQTVH